MQSSVKMSPEEKKPWMWYLQQWMHNGDSKWLSVCYEQVNYSSWGILIISTQQQLGTQESSTELCDSSYLSQKKHQGRWERLYSEEQDMGRLVSGGCSENTVRRWDESALHKGQHVGWSSHKHAADSVSFVSSVLRVLRGPWWAHLAIQDWDVWHCLPATASLWSWAPGPACLVTLMAKRDTWMMPFPLKSCSGDMELTHVPSLLYV